MRLLDVALACAVASLGSAPAFADVSLQDLDTGAPVERIVLENGVAIDVTVRNHGGGPDLAIVFDSEEPSGGDWDLGTPNEGFGGTGRGSGGKPGARGENAEALENCIIIAENDIDEDGDGNVDNPDDESGGGIVWFSFSHAGELTLTIVDVDEDEDEPRIVMYLHGERVGEYEGRNTGDNGAQTLHLPCTVDRVAIHLDGSASIGGIEFEVPAVGVEPSTWSGVKAQYR